MSWTKVDYADDSTYPTADQHIQCLRWMPFDVVGNESDDGLWVSLWGQAFLHGPTGFSVVRLDRPGLTSAGSLAREGDWPETPVEPTDWWRDADAG